MCWIDAQYLKLLAASAILYGPSEWFAKAAIAALYLRVFGCIRWLRLSVWFAIGSLGCIFFAQTVAYAVVSFPYGNEKWELPLVLKLQKITNFAMFVSVANLAGDLFLLVVPLPPIMGLSLSLRKRIGLAAVFATAVLGTGVTILGLYYRVQLFYFAYGGNNVDATWKQALTQIIMLDCHSACSPR